ncbi:hypothetical protein PX554_26135 [Sphingomonas sp. H39-1-10]|uniref:hypothetical protein n=1 Tax=Sphingomonas pollutisoli TaxID=3030829 RepID=UPI0023B9C072|nr:hypothetical protein [Sphingomonas pollutisoli]MDF0491598.1 hypothetical protein [Sphingomonas pollutisoli]
MAEASISAPLCTVCAHPERMTIDHILACGGVQSATADRFGLSKSAVHRHWSSHVSDAWKAAAKMGPYGSRAELEKLCLEEGVSVVEGLRALYVSYQASFISNREVGATGQMISVGREMRATLNDIGRITGELLPHVTHNTTINQQFNGDVYVTNLSREIISLFTDMPEALDRLHGYFANRIAASLPSPEAIGAAAHG